MLVGLLGLLVLFGFGAFLQWERHDFCKAAIEGQLGRIHARDIEISADWFDFDEDTLTYDVEYTSPAGKRERNRCKVAIRAGADQAVYWKNPIR